MASKINISIPQPCHENWHEMTLADKGRFCNACQKNVFDFTKATDREIINAFEQNQNLCGRFLNSQLNRDLVKPKEKSSLWLTVTTAIVSFIGLGTHEATAQEPVKTEQTDKKGLNSNNLTSKNHNTEFEVSGLVCGDDNWELPGAVVTIKGSQKRVQADYNGNFKINAKTGDILVFSSLGFETIEKKINNDLNLNIVLKTSPAILGDMVVVAKKRTFFSRIFHSIGNWFK